MNSSNDQGSTENKVNAIYWFRKALRLHDNPSLRDCVKSATSLYCVYILDPWFACSQHSVNEGINKWRFLLQSLEDLDNSLKKLNLRLYVLQGQPVDVLPKLFSEWKIKLLAFEYDSEPFGKHRDNSIKRLAGKSNVRVIVRVSHTLQDPDAIILLNKGRTPVSYQRFKALFNISHPPADPIPTLTAEDCIHCDFSNLLEYEDLYRIPSLGDLGFETDRLKPSLWKGGETEALKRMENHLQSNNLASKSPNQAEKSVRKLLESRKNTLSPYLAFGCLSSRMLYFRLQNLHREKSQPVAISQLLWREYIYTLSTNNHKFDTPEGNPNCMKLPWSCDTRLLNAWKLGKTGFPWIDAIMTQLRQEGWIHQICRYAVACFLTWGDLWISWDEGMEVFDKYMIDTEWSMNAGFWMRVTSVPFLCKFSKTFDPVTFGKTMDPSGEYIRRYLPILEDFPDQFIHSPWTAHASLQERVGCIIGKDYPKPIINHSSVNEVNLHRIQSVMASMTDEKTSNTIKNLFKAPLPVDKVIKSRKHSVLSQKRHLDIDEQHVHSLKISKLSQENDAAHSCFPPRKINRSFRCLPNSKMEGAKNMLDQDMNLSTAKKVATGDVFTDMPLSSDPATENSNVPVRSLSPMVFRSPPRYTFPNVSVRTSEQATGKNDHGCVLQPLVTVCRTATASYLQESPLQPFAQNFPGASYAMFFPLPLPLDPYFPTKGTGESLDHNHSNSFFLTYSSAKNFCNQKQSKI